MNTEYCECVFVALFNQNAKLFRHIIFSSVASPSQQLYLNLIFIGPCIIAIVDQ